MKVSKLFHWLYGALMLLPLFSIVSKVLYVTFNKNAYMSNSQKENKYQEVYYQSNELTQTSDMVVGNYYQFNVQFLTTLNVNTINCDLLQDTGTDIFSLLQTKITYVSMPNVNFSNFISGNVDYMSVSLSKKFYDFGEYQYNGVLIDYDNAIDSYNYSYTYFSISEFTLRYSILFEYLYDDDIDFDYLINRYSPNNSGYIELTQVDNNIFYEMEEIEISTLDNTFYNAVEELNEQPLFSWASDSFLSQPITYISNLFGMPSDSPLLTMLSYWLDISIIWLTFDLIMYVPLLVHRWLDKGILE